MSGVLGTPYFVTLYTGVQYDYNTGTPIGIDPTQFGLSSSDKSLMTSILSCGTFFGALISGDVADLIGRRPTIIAGCGVFSIGCILEIASTNQIVLFVIGRLVAGLGKSTPFAQAIAGRLLCLCRERQNVLMRVPPRCRLHQRHHHLVHVRDQPEEGSRRASLGLPVLHHARHLVSELRHLRLAGPQRYRLVPDSHRRPVPLGHHPGWWPLSPPYVPYLSASMLIRAWLARICSETY